MDKNTSLNHQEEIDLLEVVKHIWDNRKRIAVGTAFFTFVGLLYALLATPIYHSEAIITPKEFQKSGGSAAILSQFGGLGGIVATQLGMGNTNLDRIEIVLKGRELAEKVIQSTSLMPALYPDEWNDKTNRWKEKDSSKLPLLRDGIELLRTAHLTVSVNKKTNTIIIGINFNDPRLAEKLVNAYMIELNKKVRADIIHDAEANREYLENNAKTTTDPTMRDKIQNLIASEIERMMLVNAQSFDVLEKPVVARRPFKPKKKAVLMASFFLGIVSALAFIAGRRLWTDIKSRSIRIKNIQTISAVS